MSDEVKGRTIQLLVDKYYFAMKRSYNCAADGLESNYWYYQGEAATVAEILILIFKEPHPKMSEPMNKTLKAHVQDLRRKYEATWRQEHVVVTKEAN